MRFLRAAALLLLAGCPRLPVSIPGAGRPAPAPPPPVAQSPVRADTVPVVTSTPLPTPAVRADSAAPVALPTGPRLRIIATTDFHGALEPRPDAAGVMRGGAAALAGAIVAARSGCPAPDCHAILLDGGDIFQGTPASNFAFGRPVVEAYNAIGYAAAALGNHEFDWGIDSLRSLMRAADFRILGANVRDSLGRDVDWIPNDTVVRRGPFTIGIIGVATVSTPVTTRAENVGGLRFVAPAPIVDSIAQALRGRGADAVIVVAHAGGRCSASGECQGEILELAASLTQRVDAIVAGHTHSALSTSIAGTAIVQALSRGAAYAVVDLPMGKQDWTAQRSIVPLFTDSVPHSPVVAEIVGRAAARVKPVVERTIARVATDIVASGAQNPLGNLVADAMRVVGRADLAVMNNGGLRAPIRAGVATYGALYEVQPFANTLYRVRVRGRDLRAYFTRALSRGPNFHVSGARLVYSAGNGVMVDSLLVSGAPIDESLVYTVIVNDFILGGGDGLGFVGMPVTSEPVNLVDLDALIAYMRSLPQPVVPPAETRIRRSDAG